MDHFSRAPRIGEFVKTRRTLLDQDRRLSLAYQEHLKTSVETLTDLERRQLVELTKVVGNLTQPADLALQRLRAVAAGLQEFKDGVSRASPVQALEQLRVMTNDTRGALDALRTALKSADTSFQALHGIAGETEQDLRAVDAILTDFVNIAQRKIDALGRVDRTVGS